ncbi:hypothetical protein MAR_033788 [Mya arenaria]|uniref:G domain-containing protein n=1 Tax=Mya arenaria TaxID=6604 RepID=A0ABY7GE59_MYAAR|nr:hypothetical protein MAR_033788 [Mya arenaria]
MFYGCLMHVNIITHSISRVGTVEKVIKLNTWLVYHQQVRLTSPINGPVKMEDIFVQATRHPRVPERKLKRYGASIKILKDIKSLCQRSQQPEVILLVGDVGAGKSSLVNTIIQALTEQHLPRAKTGKGYIPTGTSINYLEEYQRKFGVGKLSRKFNASDPALEVTKIVFVIDAQSSSLPYALIDGIQHHCDLFVVLTKMDVTDQETKLDSTASVRESNASREKRERELAEMLTIEGALNDNLFRWINYNDNITEQNPEIDIIALTSQNPEVVLLLGNVGAGKSSLVNTIIQALTEQHLPRAKTGKGGTLSKTVTLQRSV